MNAYIYEIIYNIFSWLKPSRLNRNKGIQAIMKRDILIVMLAISISRMQNTNTSHNMLNIAVE